MSAQHLYSPDSLRRQLQKPEEDTAEVMTLLRLGDVFQVTQPDTAMMYYNRALTLSKRVKWEAGTGQYISHAIRVLNNQGKYAEALTLCQQALRLYQEGRDKKDLVRGYNNVANEYEYLGQLSMAGSYYLQAAQLAASMGERNFLKVLYNNLSSVFFSLQEYGKSYGYAHESYELAQQLGDSEAIALSLVNQGVNEIHLNKASVAMQHFRDVISLGQRLHDYTFICDGYNNIGSIHMNAKLYRQAQEDFTRVLLLATQNDNPGYKILGLSGLSDVFAACRQWKQADTNTRQAIALALLIGDRNKLAELYKKAAEIGEGLSDYKTALVFRNKYEALNDSLLNEKTRDHVNELEVRYQGAQKDRQLAEQRLSLEETRGLVRTRNLQLYGMCAGIAVLTLVLVLGRRLVRQKQNMALLHAELRGQEQERKRIAREMHDDMGAGLTTVLYLGQALCSTSAPDQPVIAQKIIQTTTSLVETMNEIVWSMNRRYDTLEDLVAYIRQHTSVLLEQAGLEYELDIPEAIPQVAISGEVRRNVYLVAKEALHNVLKHANARTVNLLVQCHNGLYIEIKDDGQGFNGEGTRFGNGLTNMRERMKTVGGDLHISSGAGTKVVIRVPL